MATQVTIISPDEVEKLVPAVVSQADQMTVSDADDYEMACSFLTLIATRKKQVGETFDPIVQKAHATHKEAIAQRDKFLSPLNLAEMNVKNKVTNWRVEEDRKRRAEEARLSAIAKKEADDRAAAEAAALEAAGDKELAAIVLQEAADAPQPVIVAPPTVPKQAGIAKTVRWTFEVVDESKLPREFMEPSDLKIGAVVRSQKALAKIPGVRVWSEESVSVRSR
jgi:hypothetical protein